MSAAVRAADPAALVRSALAEGLAPDHGEPIRLLAVGKAAPAMARACLAHAGGRVRGGLVIAPGPIDGEPPLTWMRGAHPVPDDHSVAAARAALALARSVGDDEALLVLLSGGASALMALPADGVSLEDKRAATRRLLAAAAPIDRVNCVRKHLSAVKGGRLAAATRGRLVALALSDVVGDDPSVIGSGPTVADPSTYGAALAILERHGGVGAYPPGVVAHLRDGVAGRCAETPKPGDQALARSRFAVVGSGRDAARGAAEEAARLGYRTVALDEPVVGEARVSAVAWIAEVARVAASVEDAFCVVSRGETTVDVRGVGRGGRNQEFALALVPALAAIGRPAVVASVGTDGVDGPTDAAGAMADSTTARRAADLGVDALRYLEDNDAWSFFEALGDLVVTGATGTNVGDVQIALVDGHGG